MGWGERQEPPQDRGIPLIRRMGEWDRPEDIVGPAGKVITYEDVIGVAGAVPGSTVVYSDPKGSGKLTPGGMVTIREGMHFDAVRTDNA